MTQNSNVIVIDGKGKGAPDYVVKMPVFLENVRLAAEAARKR